MASGEKMSSLDLGRWLIDNSEALKLKVRDAKWIEEWLPGYSDIQVEIAINGKRIIGSGIDKSKDLAFQKAGVEAIERAYCIENHIHSSGVAAHLKREYAQKNAANELKERDSILCHYFTKEPFVGYLPKELNQKLSFQEIKSKLLKEKVEIHLRQLKSFTGEFGFVCMVTPSDNCHQFSSIIGLGYSDSMELSARKAIQECLRGTTHYLTSGKLISENDFDDSKIFSPVDHRNLFLTPKYKKDIQELLNMSSSKEPKSEAMQLSSFQYERLYSAHDVLGYAPVYVIKAKSEALQPMFYGATKVEILNIKRLQSFSTNQFNEEMMRKIPHCIG